MRSDCLKIKSKTFIILFASIFFLTVNLSHAADTHASLTIQFHDKNKDTYIYIASGGAVAVGLTLTFFSGRYYESKKKNSDLRYASLFTFDMEKSMYEMSMPYISLDNERFFVPILKWRF